MPDIPKTRWKFFLKVLQYTKRTTHYIQQIRSFPFATCLNYSSNRKWFFTTPISATDIWFVFASCEWNEIDAQITEIQHQLPVSQSNKISYSNYILRSWNEVFLLWLWSLKFHSITQKNGIDFWYVSKPNSFIFMLKQLFFY